MTARLSALVPMALLVALIVLFVWQRPFDFVTQGVPPTEDLTTERVRLDADGIHVTLRSSGAVPVVLAQVQVDGAYWSFTATPSHAIARLASVRLDIPYPWVAGETHHLLFVTGTGVTFEHTIEVAVATPTADARSIATLLLIGLAIGVVPVAIGFGFFPAVQTLGDAGRTFVLALTVGLLVFLMVDTLVEALEFAGDAAGALNGQILVWLAALVTCVALLAIGRRSGKPPEGAALALFIALGIGVHNLGEGLAVGASLAVGEVALASFLVLGFALHNVTEGIAIIAPLPKAHAGLGRLCGLALIAGGPAALGTVAGAQSVSPLWTALAFGVGAGAILQVVIEVGALLVRGRGTAPPAWASTAGLSGFVAGIAVMYATSFIAQG